MNYICPNCSRVVARDDTKRQRAYKGQSLVMMNGTSLVTNTKQAPKLKCSCGHSIILLKGTL